MENPFFEQMLDGALKIYFKVQPNSSALKFGIPLETGELKVYLTEIPENGKANAQLIKFLSKSFMIAKSSIIIEKGEVSKKKIIIISEKVSEIIEFLKTL